jgi:hypothetical protein
MASKFKELRKEKYKTFSREELIDELLFETNADKLWYDLQPLTLKLHLLLSANEGESKTAVIRRVVVSAVEKEIERLSQKEF